ncbi:MAG TPA: hypothetical protein PKJ63_07055 [Cyclobacteriaceae bacterium]|nr:hypothetical protein [Cyclobacteriaceae bacterium]
MIKNKKLLIRRIHRYMGLFIGIQFLGWTISGLYFSWNDIDKVHGDHLRELPAAIPLDVYTVSPTIAIEKLREKEPIDSIHAVSLIRVLDRMVYQLAYFSGGAADGIHHRVQYALADAATGDVRGALTKDEGIAVAKEQVTARAKVSDVGYLEKVNGHHEYREKPLPAWAITFSDPDCTVYVSAELGTFQSIRHNQWRTFDFLWMFHTMDYTGRDNFNNWLLKTLSVLGLFTVLSGFVLYATSSLTMKRLFRWLS